MASPDRKVIHDVLASEEGVSTASKGEDPNRRVIVSPS
jgi:predicted RNA-binding protein Jag